MKRGTRIGFALSLVLATAIGVAQVQTPQPFSADVSITTKNGSKIGGKWFFAPPRIRMDMTSMPQQAANNPMGGNMSVIIDSATQTSYVLMPKLQMYMETHGTSGQNPAMAAISDLNRWQGNPCGGRSDATCKNLGTETANGRNCDKWEVTDKNGNKSTAWIDQKLHFPIRVKGDDGSDIEFSNVKEGAQDASLFAVPPGYRPFNPEAFGR